MADIVICCAKNGDELELINVLDQTRIATYVNETLNILPQDILMSPEERADFMSKWPKLINDDENSVLVLVAKCMDRIVGLCYCTSRSRLGQYVQYLYVLPDFQKQGIGSRLLQESLAWFDRSRRVWLDVVGYNTRAQEFYRKHGFRDVQMTESAIRGKPVSVLSMVKI